MVATISWLDSSSEAQRQMREFLKLFELKESRDELGLSQIRDGLSDGLFPGTSVLLTRARYLLFIPWAFIKASSSAEPYRQSRTFEYATISGLKKAGESDGLIGRQAGNSLKTLPSAMYWSALSHFGILTSSRMGREQTAVETRGAMSRRNSDESSPWGPWHPYLPPPPRDFPHSIDSGFTLSTDEASWLRDRIAQSAPNSLLGHLLYDAPSEQSQFPWDDPAARRAESSITEFVKPLRPTWNKVGPLRSSRNSKI